ncbi:hypothetical protein FRC11_001542 [Ceratobasidium sp. 423]|nr:hypothetical protein FRC11_001542 [Ceratobasidium sp. 423]
MSIFNYSYTIAFPKDTKITMAQAFEALRIKCREPMKFVPVIVGCEVLEETPTYFKRKITLNTGIDVIEEGDIYAPSLVTFKGDSGTYITNILSEDVNGDLYLTFTFAMPIRSPIAGSEEEIAEKKWVRDLASGAAEKSLKSIFEMFDEGLLS